VIDFRYHVVSLISVFLALAVGIALGAGPLKESIGAQLTGQVDQLRTEKSELREQLEDERAEANLQRAFALATAEDLLDDLLTERNVAVITAGNVEKQAIEGTIERIEQAGGKITARFDLADSWTSTSQRSFRSTLASSLHDYLDPEPEDGAGVEEKLALALAQMLTDATPDDPNHLSENSSMLQELLVSADLVSPVSAQTAPADLVIVLVPTTIESEDSEDRAELESFNLAVSELAVVLADSAEGVVVAGSSEESEDVLFQLRRDHAGAVTTVDGVDYLTGQITVALALADAVKDPGNAFGSRANADLVAPGRVDLDPPDRLVPDPDDEIPSGENDVEGAHDMGADGTDLADSSIDEEGSGDEEEVQ